MSNETKCTACDGSGLHPNEVPGVGTEWVGCPDCPDKCEWCGQSDDKHENGCRFGLGPDEPDAFDSLPIAALLHARLASWFGDGRQSFLVADLVPVVTQIVADFQYNALDMARKAHIAEIHAEEAEYHVEQLRDALDSAERRLEQAERRAECAEDGNRGLIATCEAAGAKIQALETAIQRLREALDESRGEVGTGAGEGATGQDTGTAWVTRSTDCPEAPAQAHLPACNCVPGICVEGAECCESHDCPGSGCAHEWLDRPESDTRECLICGTEATG
jgi:hypothetical protein